jgi:hypothetical protein
MREFTLVQEIDASAAEHWRAFFDPAFERDIVKALKFQSYEVVKHEETDSTIRHDVRANPRVNAPAPIAKLFGSSFGYMEEGTFDKATRVWRAHVVPNAFSGRMSSDLVMRVDDDGAGKSRRTLEFRLEARVLAIGGMVESSFEKNLRDGWRDSCAFLNDWLRQSRAHS